MTRVRANDRQRFLGVAMPEAYAVLNTMPPYANFHPLRQGIDDGGADTVQSARDFVRVLIELSASVQPGKHHFSGRNALFLMNVRRDSSAVVTNRDAAIAIQSQFDLGGVSRLDFINRVIDD